MKTKKRIWIMTAVLALITTGLVYIYLGQVKAESQESTVEMSEIVVAMVTIPAHVKVTEEMLEIKEIPTEAVHQDTYANISDVVGGITKIELIAGEQVLNGRIAKDNIEAELSYRIPENMRAITVPASEVNGVGGYIVPGDKLDILVSYVPEEWVQVVYTQLQSIEVLAVGANNSSEESSVPTSLTLLVTPAQAEVIAYANLSGSFHFTLRNPADATWQDVPSYGTENFDSWRER